VSEIDAGIKFFERNDPAYQKTGADRELVGLVFRGKDNLWHTTSAFVARATWRIGPQALEVMKNAGYELVLVLHTHPPKGGFQEGFSFGDYQTVDRGFASLIRTPLGDIRYLNPAMSSAEKPSGTAKMPYKLGVSHCPNAVPCLQPHKNN
jgi:hypothetical protein